MGTRGLTGFVLNGEMKATYNHNDSYPEALGIEMANLCHAIHMKDGWEALKKNVKKLKLVSEDKKPTKAQVTKYKQFSDDTVNAGTVEAWYCLLHKLQGADIIEKVFDGTVKHMMDSNDFLKDGLMCEHAYIINLDTMRLDYYKGGEPSRQMRLERLTEDYFKACFPAIDWS